MTHRLLLTAAAALAVTCAVPAAAQSGAGDRAIAEKLKQLDLEIERTRAYNDVQNVFSRYQYLHTAFQDDAIIRDLWVKQGTPGISAQYTNSGSYTTWDSVMEYHRNRPSPEGKLLTHMITTPLIEVAGDGQTAKGVWLVTGVESGLSSPEMAAKAPAGFFEPGEVNGKRVWAHWVQIRYQIDFMKQDGQWRIWHFLCTELSRAPFGKNWIAFTGDLEKSAATGKFHNDLAYFGDDGTPVFMPKVTAPPKNRINNYHTDKPLKLEPPLPQPYKTFSDTFSY